MLILSGYVYRDDVNIVHGRRAAGCRDVWVRKVGTSVTKETDVEFPVGKYRMKRLASGTRPTLRSATYKRSRSASLVRIRTPPTPPPRASTSRTSPALTHHRDFKNLSRRLKTHQYIKRSLASFRDGN